ncbi:MAG: glycosyltransferase [Ignavibacteriae bacterium]|nr:glycosyltransferase [Ignavibacteriota bacterium]
MIPNIFHFIYFYDERNKENIFPLSHYLAIKSASVINKPEKIYFYLNTEPSGEWWERAKEIVEVKHISPPTEVFGRTLYHPAHKSDVARIYILIENGGIYLDFDIICKKSFMPLLNFNYVMGKQGKYRKMGLCNGVILSEKNAEFLKLWLEEYRNFRSKGHDKYWVESSTEKPLMLSKKYPDLIHVEPFDSFHFPLYYPWSLRNLFVRNKNFPNAYCHHLWESESREKYLNKLTPEFIKKVDTTYNLIARRLL